MTSSFQSSNDLNCRTLVRLSLALWIIAKPSLLLPLLRIVFGFAAPFLHSNPLLVRRDAAGPRPLHVLRRRKWWPRWRPPRIRRSQLYALQEVWSFTLVALLFLLARIRFGAVERLREATESRDCFGQGIHDRRRPQGRPRHFLDPSSAETTEALSLSQVKSSPSFEFSKIQNLSVILFNYGNLSKILINYSGRRVWSQIEKQLLPLWRRH